MPIETPARTELQPLELIDQIEASWRSALSWLSSNDPVAAARDVETAGRWVQDLERLCASLEDPDLGRVRERLQDLQPLLSQLTLQSREGREEVSRALDQARHGARTLGAYRDATRQDRRLDCTS